MLANQIFDKGLLLRIYKKFYKCTKKIPSIKEQNISIYTSKKKTHEKQMRT